MIISHQYKFIFLKTNKTARMSIEIALSKSCGVDDVITPISEKDERLRSSLGYPGPQNFWASAGHYGLKDLGALLLKFRRKKLFSAHMNASRASQGLGKPRWDNYFRFCVERNPWDRVVSRYYWLHRSEPRPTFSEFIRSDGPEKLKRHYVDLYNDSDSEFIATLFADGSRCLATSLNLPNWDRA
jgi:hypothetical protein